MNDGNAYEYLFRDYLIKYEKITTLCRGAKKNHIDYTQPPVDRSKIFGL